MITKIFETRPGDGAALVLAAALVGGAEVDTGVVAAVVAVVGTAVGTAGADAPQAVAASEQASPRPAAAARRRPAGLLNHRLTGRG